jgi:hypothetical protein
MQLNIIHLPDRVDRGLLLKNELSEQNITEYRIWEGCKDEVNPKRGIAKAHKKIISYAYDNNLSSVMIAEDDIKFTSPGAFDYFLKNEPAEYDIYLGGIFYGNIKADGSVNDFAGATLYVVKQQFYAVFLSLPENENIDFDRALVGKGKFIVCDPFVAIQYNGYSDNVKKHRSYEPFFKNRRLY